MDCRRLSRYINDKRKLLQVARRIYRISAVQRMVIWLGLQSVLKSLYTRTMYVISPNQETVVIGDAQAEFTIPNPEVARHFPITDPVVIENLLNSIQENDVFYDIGGHVGTYSLLVADLITDGEIHVFEPFYPNVEQIRANAELNNADVNVHYCALSNSEGVAEFGVDIDVAGSTGSLKAEGTNIITVNQHYGDEYIDRNSLPVPSIIKIDVDGGEWDVIDGLSNTLANTECRRVYCEIHKEPLLEDGIDPADIHTRLEKYGFETTVIEESTNIRYHLLAKK